MPGMSLLQRTRVAPQPQMVIGVSDPNAGAGLKNVAITIQALLAQLQAAVSGSQIYTGTTSPSNLLGNNGDYWINTSTAALFGPKTNGLWPTTPIALTSAADAENATLIAQEQTRAQGIEGAIQTALNAEIEERTSGDEANAAAIAECLQNTPTAFGTAYGNWLASLPLVPTAPFWNNNGTPMQG